MTLRKRDFRYLWLGSAAGQLAYWVQIVAYGWLAYELTGSAAFVGLVSAATALPGLLATLPGGVVADRWNRRRILLGSQALQLVVAGLLGLIVVSGTVAPWQLAAAGGVTGLLSSINLPARQSLFPKLLPAGLVGDAVALFALSFNVSRVLGPAVAGLLIGSVGVAACFVFLTLCMALATAGLALVGPEPPRGRFQSRSLAQDFPDALSFAWREPMVRWLLAIATYQNAFGMVYVQLMPVLAGGVLGVGGGGLGVLMSATGVGATVGSVAAVLLSQTRRKGDLLLASSLIFGGAVVALAASRSMAPALGAAVVTGAAISLTMTVNQTMLTLATPDDLRGRIWSIHMMTWHLPLLAALPAGWIADQIGLAWTISAGGCLVLGLTLLSGVGGRPGRQFSGDDSRPNGRTVSDG